ncbi:MAG: phospholipase A [Bdellovibrionales bacterium]
MTDLYPHKVPKSPFYFAYGEPLSKIQLSFKTPLVRKQPLYFGYTQTMFWALREESRPFRDVNYNPELFYRYTPDSWEKTSVDFGLWSHTSNGQRGSTSRSYEMNYIRLNFEHKGRHWLIRTSGRLSYKHDFDPTNRDLTDYVSPLTLGLTFVQLFDAWFDKGIIDLEIQPGGKFAHLWDRGGYQLSWSFRLGRFDIVPAFYLQYYYGYGETLLNYSQSVSEFRGGIVF